MFAKSVAVFALLFAAAASAITIDTPKEISECQNVDWTWHDGQSKYLLAIVHGETPCADAIHEFDETSDTKQTWQANLPAGSQVQAVVIDSTGTEAWSGVITIKSGDKGCLPKVESAPAPPPKPSSSSTTPKPTTAKSAPSGVANVEAGAANVGNAAASSFVISSAAVAGVVGVAALLF